MRLLVELAQHEDLDLRVGLLFCAIQASREHLGVVQHERVALAKVVEHIAEIKILSVYWLSLAIFLKEFYLSAFAMKHHEARLITTIDTERLFLSFIVNKLTLDAVRI